MDEMDQVDEVDGVDGKGNAWPIWIALTAAALCAACGSEKEPVAVQAPAVRAVAEAPKTAQKTEPRRAEMSKENIASYRSLLRDGRRKVQAKEYGAGIALYEKALASRPGDTRLLVELGWAAFLAGDLERAAQATRQGLAGVRDPKAEGSALYNLGRIAEQRGDKAEAERRYRASLAVRPNAIVEKRLAALGEVATAATDVAAEEEHTEVGPLEGPVPSLEEVCRTLVAKNVEAGGGEVGCELAAAQILEIGEGALKRALLLPVWRSYIGGGFETAAEVMRYLVVETDDGLYHTGAWVSYVYNPGAFGIWEELESELSLEELVPGGPREIVMKATHQRADTDLGILEQEGETTEWLLVCGLVGGAPRCLAKIPKSYSYERSVMQMEGIDPSEPVEHTEGLPIRSSYGFRVEFDGKGGYTLTEAARPLGDAAVQAGARQGTFSLL